MRALNDPVLNTNKESMHQAVNVHYMFWSQGFIILYTCELFLQLLDIHCSSPNFEKKVTH